MGSMRMVSMPPYQILSMVHGGFCSFIQRTTREEISQQYILLMKHQDKLWVTDSNNWHEERTWIITLHWEARGRDVKHRATLDNLAADHRKRKWTYRSIFMSKKSNSSKWNSLARRSCSKRFLSFSGFSPRETVKWLFYAGRCPNLGTSLVWYRFVAFVHWSKLVV